MSIHALVRPGSGRTILPPPDHPDIRLRVLSLGAGVQSTTLALMAAHGEIGPMPDCAIFADTGWEPQAVYAHLDWLRSSNVLPFPVHVVSGGDLRADLVAGAAGNRWASIPAFTRTVTAAGTELPVYDEVLPDWFYRGVLDRSLVLAIDPAYFRLTGGIERWLYRVARKHAGRQPRGWIFEIAHLHEKSGSLAKLADFAFDIRRIAARQPLPGYGLRIERDGRRELLRIIPADLSTGSVDNPVRPLGTSGVAGIGTSGVPLSGLRASKPQLSLWPETTIPALNLDSNNESNLFLESRAGGKPRRRPGGAS